MARPMKKVDAKEWAVRGPVPFGWREAIMVYAMRRRLSVAEIVREAVAEWAQKRGVELPPA